MTPFVLILLVASVLASIGAGLSAFIACRLRPSGVAQTLDRLAVCFFTAMVAFQCAAMSVAILRILDLLPPTHGGAW